MKRQAAFLSFVLFSLVCQTANAQSCDPWITKAYKQLYEKTPSADECNIRNYNNGRWNNYLELVEYIAAFNRYRPGTHLKGDPWIFKAYVDLYQRGPRAIELNIQAYNNGSWGSYDELKNYIDQTQRSLAAAGVNIKEVTDCSGNRVATIAVNGKTAIDIVSNNEGKILAKGKEITNPLCLTAQNADSEINKLVKSKLFDGFSFHYKATKRVLSVGTQVVPTSGGAALVIE